VPPEPFDYLGTVCLGPRPARDALRVHLRDPQSMTSSLRSTIR
jgi:hypothetical protein